MEEEIIIGILVHAFFSNEECHIHYERLNFFYKKGGVVQRGKLRMGGDMFMSGWQHNEFFHTIQW
jgi:hypothetical protein